MHSRRLVTGRLLIASLTMIVVSLATVPPIASATHAPTRTATVQPTRAPTISPTPSSTALPAKGQLYDIAWGPDSSALFVYSSAGIWRYSDDPWSIRPILSVPAAAFGTPYSGGLVTAFYAIANELIATVGSDRTIRLWDPRDGMLKNTLSALDADVNGLAFSPDGSLVVASTAAPEGALHIWDLSTNLVLATLVGDEPTDPNFDQAPNLTFSADSQTLIYTTRTGEIVEWLRAANLVRSTAQQGHFVASRDGFMLAIPSQSAIGANSASAAVAIFDVRANTLAATLKNSELPFQVMRFSADNQALFALSDNHFWHWSLPDGSPSINIRLVAVRDTEAGIYYNPARSILAHVSQFGHFTESDPFLEVRVQNMISGISYQLNAQVTNWGEQQRTPVAFSPDGTKLAVAGHNGVQIWDVATGQTLALLTGYADRS